MSVHSRWFTAALVASLCLILMLDLTTPLGMVEWVLYIIPTALSLRSNDARVPIAVASVATVFVFLGLHFSPRGLDPEIALINRSGGLLAVWGLALVGRNYVRQREDLQETERRKHVQLDFAKRIAGELSPESLGDRALAWLAPHVGAAVGAMYVLDGARLKVVAAYAVLPDDRSVSSSFAVGEGWAGRAAKDRELLIVDDIPDEYFVVRSVLVGGSPRALAEVPLLIDDELQGVLELGFMRVPDAAGLDQVREFAALLATSMRAARYRDNLKQLLTQTQDQADQLQVQQEELRVTNEELEEQTRALQQAQAELEAQQSHLEETNAELEMRTALLEQQKDQLGRARQVLAERAAEAEQANRHKSEFLANMSHELRTPLNSALILAKLLGDNEKGNLTPEQVRFANTIYAAGNDLLNLINDILDLAKVEAGKLDVHLAPVKIERLVEQCRRMFGPVAQDRGLQFDVVVDHSAQERLETDEVRVMQILKNLLSNAFKFTEHGKVTLDVRGDASRLMFTVTDTGTGMDPSQLELIFEPFRQLDGTASRRQGGAGLGLSISRELALKLGGSIRVNSQRGRGSTFVLQLPRERGEEAANRSAPELPELPEPAEPRPAPAVPRAPAVADDREGLGPRDRVLLVIEDDVRFAELLVDLARELGFKCLVATSAAEGLALARTHGPHGILLDLRLPDDSGLAVLERLKRQSETRHIPVHIVSALDYAAQALSMGAIGFAAKPADRGVLARAIEKLEETFSASIRRLLIVEDDPVQRDGLAKLLAADGIEVVTVGTMREALARLDALSFDCVVVDLGLSDGSGFELLREMATRSAGRAPPTIVYTARMLSEAEEHELLRYSSSIIVKGARSPERLLEEVSLFLHQVESELPAERRKILQQVRDRESVFGGRRILIVEDDVRNVFALTAMLEPKGATVVIARNGREALEKLAAEPDIDLVLMDIMMPEMDGITATREIRKDKRWARLPIIALTAKAMPDDQQRCLDAGASDYLPKPIVVDRLLSLVRVWMPRQ